MAIDRARVWLEQGRHDRAESELRGVLAGDPSNAAAHALLSLTLGALERAPEAVDEARAAIGADPQLMLGHYALAAALDSRGMLDEAQPAIAEALRLEPRDADVWALQGRIHLGRRAWDEARLAAERALAVDAQHIWATNVRAQALVQMGRKVDADATLAQALARDPENATTHANAGWSLLQRRAVAEAQQHFLEALRLEPSHETARSGLLESIKARNRFYRGMQSFAFWLGRQQKRTVWFVVIGVWLLPRLLRSMARHNPALAPYVTPVILLCLVFAFLTWIMDPLFNTFLFFHPIGRHALSRREKTGAAAVTACLAGAGLSMVIGASAGSFATFVAGLVLLVFVVPLSAPFSLDNARRRRHAALFAAALGGLALTSGLVRLSVGDAGGAAAGILIALYFLGIFAMTWLVNSWSLSSRTD